MLRNPANDKFNREPKQLESLKNTGVWKHEQRMIEYFGKPYSNLLGNNILPIKLVFLFLGNGSVSQHESIHCMFSALGQIFKCPANLLLLGSMYAENTYNFRLRLISVCMSMEASVEGRYLQSERTNDHLSCHGFCAWDKQVLGRKRNRHVYTVCI